MKKSLSSTLIILGTMAGLGIYTISFLAKRSRLANNSPVRLSKSATKRKKFAGKTRDLVDENSWESFPASDPPGTY